jgi:hypothetical protein
MGESPGDLIIKINLKPDPYFKRDNYDIYTKLYLTISQVSENNLGCSRTQCESANSRRRKRYMYTTGDIDRITHKTGRKSIKKYHDREFRNCHPIII